MMRFSWRSLLLIRLRVLLRVRRGSRIRGAFDAFVLLFLLNNLTHPAGRPRDRLRAVIEILELGVVAKIARGAQPQILVGGAVCVCTQRLAVDIHDVAAPWIDRE